MTKEKLLEWGLTEEQATKVMEGLNGSFVTKARFNEVNTELTTAKNTIKERDTQLETLKKLLVTPRPFRIRSHSFRPITRRRTRITPLN